MVMKNHGYAHFRHYLAHLRPEILQAVRGRHREVTLLVARFVSQIRPLIPRRIPETFFRIDPVKPAVVSLLETDIIKYVKLRLRTEEDLVRDPAYRKVPLRLLSHVTRVT